MRGRRDTELRRCTVQFLYHNLAKTCVGIILVLNYFPHFFMFDRPVLCQTRQVLRVMVCFLGLLKFDTVS